VGIAKDDDRAANESLSSVTICCFSVNFVIFFILKTFFLVFP